MEEKKFKADLKKTIEEKSDVQDFLGKNLIALKFLNLSAHQDTDDESEGEGGAKGEGGDESLVGIRNALLIQTCPTVPLGQLGEATQCMQLVANNRSGAAPESSAAWKTLFVRVTDGRLVSLRLEDGLGRVTNSK